MVIDPDAVRRAELAAFLRSRREHLQPEDVGLQRLRGRRNTPGLRREEVAQISGVGVTWYTWLEQARPITVSDHVVAALARALRLDATSHRHLRSLVDPSTADFLESTAEATPELCRLLDWLMPAPASIFAPSFDYVAWNSAHEQLWKLSRRPKALRNVIWLTFMDTDWHALVPDWLSRTNHLLGHFRSVAGEHPGDPRFAELIQVLTEQSEDFRNRWPDYEISDTIAGPFALRLPDLGNVHLHMNELRVIGQPSLTLSVQIPVTEKDRRLLSAWLRSTRRKGSDDHTYPQ